MAKEIIIRAAFVSPELTRQASNIIMRNFGGYFRVDGSGGYTFKDGRTEEQGAVSWYIGTAAKDLERFSFLSAFATFYCEYGAQESVYMADVDGAVYFAYADGRLKPLV